MGKLSRPYGIVKEAVLNVAKFHMGGDLIRLNARFLLSHTRTYFKAFFDLNSLVWEIATPADGYVRSYLGYPESSVGSFVAAQGFGEGGLDSVTKELKQAQDTTYTGLTPVVNRYAELLYGVPVLRDLFWRGGIANLALLFSGVVLVKKRRREALLSMIPVAAVTAGLLFSMPAQEVRYVFPNLMAGVFFLCYAWFIPKAELCAKGEAGARENERKK